MKEFSKINEAIEDPQALLRVQEKELIVYLQKAIAYFKKQPNLISLPDKWLVFIGDTHGDCETAKKLIDKYNSPEFHLVFLGDYVDRAPVLYGGIRTLFIVINAALEGRATMLRGNHEDISSMSFGEFSQNVERLWSKKVKRLFEELLNNLPLVAQTDSIISLHGGLPNISSLSEIEDVPKGLPVGFNKVQDQIMWNDCLDLPDEIIREYSRGVRNTFVYGRAFFTKIMDLLDKKVLIRGHNPRTTGTMYKGRCITLMTCECYANRRMEKYYCQKPMGGKLIALVKPGTDDASAVDIIQVK